jgi:hypothetical protein
MPIKIENMATIHFENEIGWDGERLSVWAVTHRGRILCEVPRSTIHALSIYNDAIEREIERDRHEIFERLRPALVAKAVQNSSPRDAPLRLFPDDLSGGH